MKIKFLIFQFALISIQINYHLYKLYSFNFNKKYSKKTFYSIHHNRIVVCERWLHAITVVVAFIFTRWHSKQNHVPHVNGVAMDFLHRFKSQQLFRIVYFHHIIWNDFSSFRWKSFTWKHHHNEQSKWYWKEVRHFRKKSHKLVFSSRYCIIMQNSNGKHIANRTRIDETSNT